MPRGVYKPNQELIELLNEMEDTKIEVTQVRNRFEQKYQTQKPKAELRRWIQGQFRTLQKHGFVTEDEGSSPKKYGITEKVRAYLLKFKQDKSQTNIAMKDIAISIRNRMADVKVKLIESRAEANVYEELSQLYPSLREHLIEKFSETKEKQISLSGQLTAIEYALQTVESGL